MADTYKIDSLVKLQGLKDLATRISTRLTAIETNNESAFRGVKVENNKVYFYNTTDTTKTAVKSIDFPEEIFLDQAGTTLVDSFTYSAETYPNTTDPNLNGKTVLVLAVKGDKETGATVKYSFVNMEKLIDNYSASDTSVLISDYKIKVNVSAAANNAITLKTDGLHVDISSKADKVANATAGNFTILDTNGNYVDSTIASNTVLTKVSGATANNVVVFQSDGTIADSTHSIAADNDVIAMLDEIIPIASGNNS